MTAIHPTCGKAVPGGNSGGHCAGCCESFRGTAAAGSWWMGRPPVRIRCFSNAAVTPNGKPLDYWRDYQGVWHLGPRDPRFTKEDA